MLYVKLTLRNVKRSIKEYALFLFTMSMSMLLVYVFFAVFYSERILQISSMIQKFSTNLLPMISACVVLILSWLINYVIHCIFKKRSREFGLYLLSGMERKKIAGMFVGEQLLLGCIALIIGVVLGGVLAQVMEYCIMTMFELPYTFSLTWNLIGIVATVVVFGLIYIVEMIKETMMIHRANIKNLMYLSDVNEQHRASTKKSVVVFLLAILCFFTSVGILLQVRSIFYEPDVSVNITSIMIAIGLMIASIYLCYMGLSDVVILTLSTHKARKYKGDLLFLSGQLTSKVRSNRFVLASLSILIIVIVIGLSFAFAFKQLYDKRIAQQVPFDIIASSSDGVDYEGVNAYLSQHYETYESTNLHFYQLSESLMQESLMEGLQSTRAYYPGVESVYMKESEYRAIVSLAGFALPNVLEQDAYAIQVSEDLAPQMEAYANSHSVTYKGTSLTLSYLSTYSIGQEFFRECIVILPDSYFNALKPIQEGVYANIDQPTTVQTYADLKSYVHDTEGFYLLRVKSVFIQDQLSMFLMTISTAIYLALIAICICATMIATQQFSDIREQQYVYDMLYQLGVNKKHQHRMLRKQVLSYFLLPLLLPLLYLPILISIMKDLFSISDSAISLLAPVSVAIGIFLLIYGCYFILTYVGCKRNIEEKRG